MSWFGVGQLALGIVSALLRLVSMGLVFLAGKRSAEAKHRKALLKSVEKAKAAVDRLRRDPSERRRVRDKFTRK